MSKIDWSKPIQTSTGQTAQFMGRYGGACDTAIVAYSIGFLNYGALVGEDGRIHKEGGCVRDLRIVNAPKEMWVNIYPDSGYAHNSLEDADKYAGNTRTHRVEITLDDKWKV